MWKRLLPALGSLLATAPIWPALDGLFHTGPPFDGGEFAVLLAVAMVPPVCWALLARDSTSGPVVGAVLVACAAGWSVATRLYTSWATPPAVDDILRGYLAVSCAVVLVASLVDRRHARRSRPGLALLAIGCALVIGLPAVGDAPVPERAALLPLPKGVVVVAEEAGCDWRGSCQRRFETVADDGAGAAVVMQRLTRHLERRGWRMGVEFRDKACRPLGHLANPYRRCLSILHLRGPDTVEVLFASYNPREPRVIYN